MNDFDFDMVIGHDHDFHFQDLFKIFNTYINAIHLIHITFFTHYYTTG